MLVVHVGIYNGVVIVHFVMYIQWNCLGIATHVLNSCSLHESPQQKQLTMARHIPFRIGWLIEIPKNGLYSL